MMITNLHSRFVRYVSCCLAFATLAFLSASVTYMYVLHFPRISLLSRSKRCGFCPPDLPDFDQLLEEADDQLFERILNNPHHTLYQLLPPQSAASQNYRVAQKSKLLTQYNSLLF